MPDLTLEDLAGIVARRAASGDPGSYTAELATKGVIACAKKLGEEAIETVIAAAAEDRQRLTAEAADLLYHLVVLLHVSGVPFAAVTAELGRRTGRSGLEEKASRSGSA
jgi:phosphoribosyl-ATP pyrophosphohydrolase